MSSATFVSENELQTEPTFVRSTALRLFNNAKNTYIFKVGAASAASVPGLLPSSLSNRALVVASSASSLLDSTVTSVDHAIYQVANQVAHTKDNIRTNLNTLTEQTLNNFKNQTDAFRSQLNTRVVPNLPKLSTLPALSSKLNESLHSLSSLPLSSVPLSSIAQRTLDRWLPDEEDKENQKEPQPDVTVASFTVSVPRRVRARVSHLQTDIVTVAHKYGVVAQDFAHEYQEYLTKLSHTTPYIKDIKLKELSANINQAIVQNKQVVLSHPVVSSVQQQLVNTMNTLNSVNQQLHTQVTLQGAHIHTFANHVHARLHHLHAHLNKYQVQLLTLSKSLPFPVTLSLFKNTNVTGKLNDNDSARVSLVEDSKPEVEAEAVGDAKVNADQEQE